MSIAFTFTPGSPSAASFFFDPDISRKRLGEAEDAGFSAIVIDDRAGALANFDLVKLASAQSVSASLLLTHAAGVMSPVVAAQQISLLDRRTHERLALRMTFDGAGSGLVSAHEETCRRTDEYLTLLKRLLSNERPFDHEGEFYSIAGGFVPDKGARSHRIPIRLHGRSGTAIAVAARHADIVELAPGSPVEVQHQISRVLSTAAQFGRDAKIGFALPVSVGNLDLAARSSSAKRSVASKLALALLPYVEAGVGEFMVSGAETPALMRLVAGDAASLLRKSIAPHDLPSHAEAPVALAS